MATSKFRKSLRKAARKGLVNVAYIASKADGFPVIVRRDNPVVLKSGFANSAAAIAWCKGKLHLTPARTNPARRAAA